MSVKQLLTAEEFWALPETPGARYELVRGELSELPGTGGKHGRLALWIGALLLRFVGERGLGVVSGDGTGYLLYRDPDLVRIPDVSFVARERVPAGGVPEGFWPFAPDLVVEIVSPNDRAEDVQGKVREYLAAGTRLVWVVWPRLRLVTMHEAGGGYRERGPDDDLDGGDVLPGFRVRVAELLAVGP
jgi:Uma2 family endonuclease